MKMTDALKKHFIGLGVCSAESSDEDFQKAAATALVDGSLSTTKYAELTADDAAPVNAFQTQMSQVLDAVKSIATKQAELETKLATPAPVAPEKAAKGADTAWYDRVVGNVLGGDIKDTGVRVKGAHEQYSTTKSVAVYPEMVKGGMKRHPMAGQPMTDFSNGRVLDNASELEKAASGAYAKFMIQMAVNKNARGIAFRSLAEHDRELLLYAITEMKWSGASDGGDRADIIERKLSPVEQKALIDDATSGGLEAAPIAFDDMVIQAPLLNGELYPLVNVVPLDRGRRVEGVAVGKVTGSWGGVDDTAITLFTTTSYVSAFDTTIFRWEGAIKIGLDFMSDTPIDFGSIITAQYGERLLEDLDDVIAAGNGTTQPEGVINKSGATSVAFGGITSLGNYESLRFGVPKQEHRPNVANTAVFCGTETSYVRARAIPVGAADARRLGGMDYSSYSWMERPYKINGSLSNSQIFYAIMARYRMYRRRGLTFRSSSEGDTLIRSNELLISCTARFGGQMERGACIAKTTTAPA